MFIKQLARQTHARLAILEMDRQVRDAAIRLSRPGIGLVVICAGGTAIGVVSKSDLVGHLAAPVGRDARLVDLMTRSMVSCSPEEDLRAAWTMMSDRGLQNVPVLDPFMRPLGTLDIRDAMAALLEQDEIEERHLTDYIAGIGYAA